MIILISLPAILIVGDRMTCSTETLPHPVLISIIQQQHKRTLIVVRTPAYLRIEPMLSVSPWSVDDDGAGFRIDRDLFLRAAHFTVEVDDACLHWIVIVVHNSTVQRERITRGKEHHQHR